MVGLFLFLFLLWIKSTSVAFSNLRSIAFGMEGVRITNVILSWTQGHIGMG